MRGRVSQAGKVVACDGYLCPPRCGVRPWGGPGSSPPGLPALRPPAPHPPQALVPQLQPCLGPSPESRSVWLRESRGGTAPGPRGQSGRRSCADGGDGGGGPRGGGGCAHSRTPSSPPAPGSLLAGNLRGSRWAPTQSYLPSVDRSRPHPGLIGHRRRGGSSSPPGRRGFQRWEQSETQNLVRVRV